MAPGLWHSSVFLNYFSKWLSWTDILLSKLKKCHANLSQMVEFRYPIASCISPGFSKTLTTSATLRLCLCTVYPKNYTHGFCFAVLFCGYTLTDFPISIRLTSLALWQSNDDSKATLMNMDKYFMWNHYERLHNHNKAKHNKTVCICLGIYCTLQPACFPCLCVFIAYHYNN